MSADTSTPSAAARLYRTAVRFRVPIALFLLVLFLRAFLADPQVLGYHAIAPTFLILMLFAISFNFLLGYTGLLSFGHALFLGTGVYTIAIGVNHIVIPVLGVEPPFLVWVVIAILLAAVAAYAIGRLIADRGEIYFAMLTLAFAETAHFVVNRDFTGITGGSAGLGFDPPGWIESVRGTMWVTLGPLEFEWYYLAAAVFLVASIAVWQLVRSPFGRSLVAVRENEQLARAIGIDTRRYKVWAFTISGGVAAVAGVLMVVNNGTAQLSSLSITTSGDIIMMSVLGGTSYFVGPIVGVLGWKLWEEFLTGAELLVLPLRDLQLLAFELGEVSEYWQFFLGGLFVVMVLIAPRQGLWGGIRGMLLRVTGFLSGLVRGARGPTSAGRGGDDDE